MSLRRWRDSGAHFSFLQHSIFFQQQGQGDTALLLLHGLPTSSWDFEALWPQLGRAFARVLAPDLLGFGFSDKPRQHRYQIAEQADLCEALLREQGVAQVHVLAQGYGVSVVQEMLARNQAGAGVTVQSCVFLNGGLFPEVQHTRWAPKLLRSVIGGLLVRLAGERSFNRRFSEMFGPQTRPGPIELHDYWTLLNVQQGRRALPRLLHYLKERRRQRERWVGALTRAALPMALICGEADRIAGLDTAARFAQLLPQAERVMLEGVGHFPQIEAPDRVLRAFLAFHRRQTGLTWDAR